METANVLGTSLLFTYVYKTWSSVNVKFAVIQLYYTIDGFLFFVIRILLS